MPFLSNVKDQNIEYIEEMKNYHVTNVQVHHRAFKPRDNIKKSILKPERAKTKNDRYSRSLECPKYL